MKIDISTIIESVDSKISFKHSEELKEDIRQVSLAAFSGIAGFEGVIKNIDNVLKLTGNIEVVYSTQCGRCAKEIKRSLSLDVEEELIEKGKLEDNMEADESFVYENSLFDISELVREYVFLNLPMNHLCSTDCKGVCSVCGQDLNEGSCDCSDKSDIDPRMEKLKDFFKD